MDKTSHYNEMTVGALKALCKDRRLGLPKNSKGDKAAYVALLVEDDAEQTAWEALKANPPPLPVGYRFVMVTGRVYDVVLTDGWMEDHRYHHIHATIYREHPEFDITGSGHTWEQALANIHTNLGSNERIREFLCPGERTREELLAEIAALKARTTPSPWIAP